MAAEHEGGMRPGGVEQGSPQEARLSHLRAALERLDNARLLEQYEQLAGADSETAKGIAGAMRQTLLESSGGPSEVEVVDEMLSTIEARGLTNE